MNDLVPVDQGRPPALGGRGPILAIEAAMQNEIVEGRLTEMVHTMPLSHHFIPGAYARELTIPAGTLLVGKIHKEPCFNFVSKGTITVVTEEGRKDITAPAFFRSEAGVKRVGYAHTETVWTTVHATEETDLDKIEDHLTYTTYEQFDLAAQKQPLQLGKPQ